MTDPITRMQNWKAIVFNISFGLNCLLVFLLFFESRLVVPAWLQVIGRLHPMLLHFPLVLIILYALITILLQAGRNDALRNFGSLLLLLASFTSVVTAIMGLLLSQEEGYDAEALMWHKWGGVTISVISLSWYWAQEQVLGSKPMAVFTSMAAIGLIVFTGHLGAGITHGDDFLLAPVTETSGAAAVPLEEAEVYQHMVRPILQRKCMSCHNSRKAKGELVMESEELLMKGGKNGKLWDSTQADFGLLLQRIHLPVVQKEHMPPKNKPQLTDQEITILEEWIRSGSDFKTRVADLEPSDTMYQIAREFFGGGTVTYDFAGADPAVIIELNTANRVVSQEAKGSPALTVNFYNNNLFDSKQLQELTKVKKQIVSLNLARMPLKDEDLKIVSQFENLRQLNLSFTGISGNNLQELKKLSHLESLSLSGTGVSASHLEHVKNIATLRTLYLWNTRLSKDEIERLRQEKGGVNFETGFNGDTVVLKLSPPVSLNEKRFISGESMPLKLKHYIQGAAIHFTTDGSDPDSIRSAIYKGNETVDKTVLVKARAFKRGWLGSDMISVSFLKSKHTPDTVIHLSLPDDKHRDVNGKLLINGETGETDFRLGNWVGYRERRMECLLQYEKPIIVESVSLSSLADIGSYIFPAASIEIWGGKDRSGLRLLGSVVPVQPAKQVPAFMLNLDCRFKPVEVSFIRIIAHPVAKLPSWHPGKGTKGWIFIDEVLVN